MQYNLEEFIGDKPRCDVVMKGGITSGTVYPLAIVEIARAYRIASIGGTSAGALAAAITAAAEYARADGGYVRIASIPEEISRSLLSFFQPDRQLRPLFRMLVAALSRQSRAGKLAAAVSAAVAGYPAYALTPLVAALIIAVVLRPDPGAVAFLVVLSLVASVGLVAWRLARALARELPEAGWGICSGLTRPGETRPALTDWLADKIDLVAGRDPQRDPPLTFGDLKGGAAGGHAINLQVMTTNLSMRRPYQLPLRERSYLFRACEMRRLFPARIVDWMIANTAPFRREGEDEQYRDFYHFPRAEALPIVVAARMSLSFPGLIAAVPLWIRDFTEQPEFGGTPQTPKLCWFSDGGLSSNFPIHFFDRLWPGSPTFAIALDAYERKRHGDRRVALASAAGQGILLPVHGIEGLGNFLMTLLDAAKDWQDNLQSVLPGYRERVIRIALKPEEGGLNLTMGPETIDTLTELGREAGKRAREEFDFDEHRWRRFLVSMARLEETLDELKAASEAVRGESFADFLARYPPETKSYRPAAAWLEEARGRADELVELARRWQETPRIADGEIPRPASEMRITPKP